MEAIHHHYVNQKKIVHVLNSSSSFQNWSMMIATMLGDHFSLTIILISFLFEFDWYKNGTHWWIDESGTQKRKKKEKILTKIIFLWRPPLFLLNMSFVSHLFNTHLHTYNKKANQRKTKERKKLLYNHINVIIIIEMMMAIILCYYSHFIIIIKRTERD